MRIGRYLNQFVITREDKVQNVVNTESSGVGVRVIANGTWGFAATSDMVTPDCGRQRGASRRSRSPRPTRKLQTEPVQLAPTKGVGEVSLEDADREERAATCRSRKRSTCCSASTRRRMKAGANFVNSILFLVNEQKYFASTDGSYIDQDIHRIWAPTSASPWSTRRRGKFRTRDGLSAPVRHGLRVPRRRSREQRIALPGGAVVYSQLLRHDRGRDRGGQAGQGKAHRASR